MGILLKKGDHNTKVALWQGFLNSYGYKDVLADAYFGQKTEAATRGFQAASGLRADGIVGSNTIAAAMSVGFAGFDEKDDHVPDGGKLKGVHPTLADKANKILALAAAEGFDVRVTQGLRTFAEQDALYAQGRTRKGSVVTNAKGGRSNHNYGLAVDLAFFNKDGSVNWDDKLYKNIGRWAKAVGLDWGGDWKSIKDLPHVELPDIPKWQTLLAWHQKGGVDAVWKNVT